MRRSVAFPSSPYYEYHGADPNAYYGIPYRSDGGVILPRKNKRSFTEKLSQKLDKFGRTRDRDRSINRAYQEVYRDHYGNVFMPRVGGITSTPEPWLQHYSSSPGPRRTFHNVIQRGRSAPSAAGSNRSYGGGGWENVWGGHQSRGGSNSTVYGDVLYDDYQNFAINSNVCMCEDFLGGTQRGKKSSKKCKKCGYDRMGFGTQGALRRSASEESVNAQQNADPYEYMRRRRMLNPKPVYYDEQDEYEEVMYEPPDKINSERMVGQGVARSRSPQVRRSSSPGALYITPTLKQSNSNRSGKLNTKDCKEMQNIAIRSSPIRTPNSTFKRSVSANKKPSNVVTVNGCATKNSSIIYLSPDTSPPPTPLEKDYPGANAVNIVTSTPTKPHGGESHISPYDLIKKYVVDSPANSLSDSNLSSDDPPGEKSYQKSMESDFSDSDDDDDNVNIVSGLRLTGNNSFRISGQKIQIYSDGSVATDNKYSMSESDEESTDDNNYDADCSVVESPRVPDNHLIFPNKPSRMKEMSSLAVEHSLEQLNIEDLEEIEAHRTSPTIDEIKPVYNKQKIDIFGPVKSATLDRKSILSRKKSSDSQKSLSSTTRSKSFNGSRESLSLFHSAELKNQGISKNFSSDIIRELYGSKTSLLKHLDQQREDRQQLKQLEQARDSSSKTNKNSSRGKQDTVSSQNERKEAREQLVAKHAQAPEMKNHAVFHDKVQRSMFNDTTRLRPTSRPSLKDALQSFSAAGSTKLGRLGISQSFRDRITTPLRPKDPPPPPPMETVAAPTSTKKLFSFNKSEIKRINKLLGISGTEAQDDPKSEKNMYDIAEHDEIANEPGVTIVENSTFYDGDIKLMTPRIDKKKEQNLRLRPKSNEFFSEPVKPPRAKRERSKSFTPRSNPKTSIFNRSFSHIPKSSSSSSLSVKSKSDKKMEQRLLENNHAKRTLSSSDLIHIFPDEERRSFKDIRKILSSPSISSSSSANQIYRPKSQLSNSSSVINNSIKEEKGEAGSVSREPYFEHIYEEIKDKDIAHHETSQSNKRPLPPLPADFKSSSSPSRSSPILSSQESPVKSIFEGATKYDILHYLEDARERGLTDCDLDLDEDDEEAAVEVVETGQTTLILSSRNHANRISNISNNSNSSSDSSSPPVIANKDKLTTVEIERNDSGLGSETSRGRGCGAKVIVRKRIGEGEEVLCLDCDPLVEQEQNENSSADLCSKCERHRGERKEIITEIIETEIKYGRDLRIIVEEFYRPMMVAGLLTHEQLANIFLNAEELKQFNDKFTDSLKESIGIALDQGDEDLCTVSIGKLFLEASPMLGAFKSYCTRQGSASNLLASLEREKELLRIFLKVSQMENTILRRMNLSSFLMVPVQRVTRYPLLLSRLLKVTPSHQGDREAIQEAQEAIESGLDSMNQETSRDTGTTKLWRRISMINPQYRRSENQLDVLGSTTWGVRKMALESLGWSRESRDDITFHRESRVSFTQPTDVNWRSLWTSKLQPINALLVTLGQNTLVAQEEGAGEGLQFPRDTGCREAALILMKEKGFRYQSVREPLMLDRCVVCWEQDWDDCFEVTEFTTKESYIFKAETEEQTLEWFRSLQFYCLSLGQWRRRRNALANIMINGMARSEEINREFNLIS